MGFVCSWRPAWATAPGARARTHFDALTVMEEWVEQGKAPDQIIALADTRRCRRSNAVRCVPYPQRAVYSGTGSTDDAANFVCQAP